MRTFITLIALSISAGATAQTWTIDRCIDYAIENNIDVKNRKLSQYEGELEVTEAKDRFLPSVSGYASQNFSFGRGLTAENTYANRNTSGFSVGAQLNLPIFQGLSAVRRLEYSRTALKSLIEQTEATKDDVSLNVTAAYLQALYASEMVNVARLNAEISQRELLRRRELLAAGKIPELDIYESQAQVSSDELAVVQAQNDSIIALLDLAQLLNLPNADGFEIAPLTDEAMPLVSPQDVFENAMRSNHSILAGRYNSEAAAKNVALAKTGYIPTLSFSAGLGTNYYNTSGFNNESFGQQMRHNFSRSIGLSLSVPLFDAFGTRNNVRRARARQTAAQLNLQDSENRLLKAITQAYTQALGAEKKLESATTAASHSQAAYEAMKVKYDNGRANATEFEKAKSDYTKAVANCVQAKYERILRTRILNFYNNPGR